jgi:hypothetical protein
MRVLTLKTMTSKSMMTTLAVSEALLSLKKPERKRLVMCANKMYTTVPHYVVLQRTSKDPISYGWGNVNKGDDDNVEIRCRLDGKELAMGEDLICLRLRRC